MKHNTTRRRFLILSFVIMLLISLSSNTLVAAIDVDVAKANTELMSDVTSLVDNYMDGRMHLLVSNDSEYLQNIAVAGIIADELVHKEYLARNEISILESSYDYTDVKVEDYQIIVTLDETISYVTPQSNAQTENVLHTLRLFFNENDNLIVVSDAYVEALSLFESCSYVAPTNMLEQDELLALVQNSSSCFVYTAKTQIGYKEKATNENLDSFTANAGSQNYTKYGAWYGKNGQPWCAMFVSWCANQAKIATSVIPMYSYCPDGLSQFKNLGVYHTSGLTYTPKVGDIFFEGVSDSTSSHTGIVVAVSGNTITVVDGNCDDQVSCHTYALTSSSILGYASPNYGTSSHSWTTYGNYYRCSICGLTSTSIPGIQSIN